MVARYGQKSQPALGSVEARALRHYQKIAGDAAPVPSFLLLQAPIFHGYAMAIYLEMKQAVDVPALRQALAGDHVSIPGAEDEPPSNVSSAGQGDIQLSVNGDPTQPNAAWLWASADNLRIAALNAVECAESMAATRPTGKIQ
jgi:Aspartate-semialdehyde dehydrogenase